MNEPASSGTHRNGNPGTGPAWVISLYRRHSVRGKQTSRFVPLASNPGRYQLIPGPLNELRRRLEKAAFPPHDIDRILAATGLRPALLEFIIEHKIPVNEVAFVTRIWLEQPDRLKRLLAKGVPARRVGRTAWGEVRHRLVSGGRLLIQDSHTLLSRFYQERGVRIVASLARPFEAHVVAVATGYGTGVLALLPTDAELSYIESQGGRLDHSHVPAALGWLKYDSGGAGWVVVNIQTDVFGGFPDILRRRYAEWDRLLLKEFETFARNEGIQNLRIVPAASQMQYALAFTDGQAFYPGTAFRFYVKLPGDAVYRLVQPVPYRSLPDYSASSRRESELYWEKWLASAEQIPPPAAPNLEPKPPSAGWPHPFLDMRAAPAEESLAATPKGAKDLSQSGLGIRLRPFLIPSVWMTLLVAFAVFRLFHIHFHSMFTFIHKDSWLWRIDHNWLNDFMVVPVFVALSYLDQVYQRVMSKPSTPPAKADKDILDWLHKVIVRIGAVALFDELGPQRTFKASSTFDYGDIIAIFLGMGASWALASLLSKSFRSTSDVSPAAALASAGAPADKPEKEKGELLMATLLSIAAP